MAAPANTLTALAPVLYSAAQEVAAEPFGIVDSIAATFDNKGVAKGDKVKVPIAPAAAHFIERPRTAPVRTGSPR